MTGDESPLRRTRVMMITDSLAVGGAERVAVDTANTLDPDRYEVRLCSTRLDGPLRARIEDRIPVTVLNRAATWDVSKLLAFATEVRDSGIDIIHSHGRGSLKFVALTQALGLIDVKHVFHDHFGWLHIDRGVDPGLRRALRTCVDLYIGVDARLCEWAVHTVGLDPERVHLVRSGVDMDRFLHVEPAGLRDELDLPDDAVVVMMVANFRPPKDHPTLFRAIAELSAEQRRRLRLVIVGATEVNPDYFANCMAMVDRLGIGDVVRVVGERENVPGLLAEADAAVLSSKNETGPLAVLEYMAAGLPFVATDTGEIAHAVKDLGVGFIPPPREHHEMADALAAMLALPDEKRRAMGERGLTEATTRFSQAVAVRKIETLYDELMGVGIDRVAT